MFQYSNDYTNQNRDALPIIIIGINHSNNVQPKRIIARCVRNSSNRLRS